MRVTSTHCVSQNDFLKMQRTENYLKKVEVITTDNKIFVNTDTEISIKKEKVDQEKHYYSRAQLNSY